MTPRRVSVFLVLATAVAAWRGLPLASLEGGSWAPLRDARILVRMLRANPIEREGAGSASQRDRRFGQFLRAIEPSLPRDARVLLLPGRLGESNATWYRYRATFLLAPRPVDLWQPRGRGPRDPRVTEILVVYGAPPPAGWVPLLSTEAGCVATRLPGGTP